jgi:hypothetical protein
MSKSFSQQRKYEILREARANVSRATGTNWQPSPDVRRWIEAAIERGLRRERAHVERLLQFVVAELTGQRIVTPEQQRQEAMRGAVQESLEILHRLDNPAKYPPRR